VLLLMMMMMMMIVLMVGNRLRKRSLMCQHHLQKKCVLLWNLYGILLIEKSDEAVDG
jgi:hypothetical protein